MTKTTLILADDHAVVRAGIRNALSGLPDIEIAAEVDSGTTLFDALHRVNADCLLIDVTMPSFEPFAAVKAIRAEFPGVKILIVSAYDDDIYVQGLLQLGANGYHLKDQPLSDLRAAVQSVLAGERWVSSRLLERLDQPAPTLDLPKLTARQREMLTLLYKGLDNYTIATQLDLSVKTVENHLTSLYRLLNVHSRLEAVNYIIQHPELLGLTAAALPPAPEARYIPRSKQTLLIVDDNERYRQQLSRMVMAISPQAQIFEANNTQRAVQLAGQFRPRLILVDVVLGDENGIQCVQRVTKISPASRVLLFSAYPDSEFHRQGIAAGASAFLDKKNLDSAALRQILADVNMIA
jgi:DNA-binding NarL/FixJ family response regulator